MAQINYPDDIDKLRLSYLIDTYKLYHGHINTMFNYFLIFSGLSANAYVSTLTSVTLNSRKVPATIAFFGFLITLILWLVHIRSRSFLDTIENNLRDEEKIFLQSAMDF